MGTFAGPCDERQLFSPQYAPFGRRFGAFVVDFICTFLIFILAAYAARLLVQAAGLAPALFGPEKVVMVAVWHDLPGSAKLFVFLNFFVCSGGVYYPLFHSSPWRATPGKRLLGIQVTNGQGSRVTLPRASARTAAKLGLHLGGWLTPISILMILLGKRKRALHDWITGTVVVRGRAPAAETVELWRIASIIGFPLLLTLGMFWMLQASVAASQR